MAEADGDSVPMSAETAGGSVMANFLGVNRGVDSEALPGISGRWSVKGASRGTTSIDLSACKSVELSDNEVHSMVHVQASSSSGIGSEAMMSQPQGSEAERTTSPASTANQAASKGQCWCHFYLSF